MSNINYNNLNFLDIIYNEPFKKTSNIFYSKNNNTYPLIVVTPKLKIKNLLDNNYINL